jgi:hypothetical protein
MLPHKQAGAELSQAQVKLGLDLLHQNYLLYLNRLFRIRVINMEDGGGRRK